MRENQDAKADAGKLRPTLVPTSLIRAVTAVRDNGERKHGGSADPWDSHPAEEHLESLYRHWLEYLDDPDSVDDESGLPVLWHIACKIDLLIELAERKRHCD